MPHLQEAPGGGRDVGEDAASLQSELRSVQGSMRAEEEALENFRQKAVQLLKAADGVVRTFQRTKLWRDAPTQYKAGQAMPTAMQELLAQPVLLPSPFLEQAAGGFGEQVAEFKKTVLAAQSARQAEALVGAGGLDASLALPTVVANMHDYFTHTAAKLERVHNELQAAKAAHRAALKQQGVHRDPFERAQQHADRQAKSRQHVPSLLPPPAAGAAAAPPGGAPGAGAAPGGAGAGQSPGGGGGGGFSSFGSPFPGTPGFGAPQGAAALGRSTSSKARPNKSRR
ncbi:MAG: hypothetical protein J3K34DRAFT_482706 [Monoraphidium minutum]|nr:MAG: hypothetical protein J3K34DRAFT_482706 [Monoraphidium minutum]